MDFVYPGWISDEEEQAPQKPPPVKKAQRKRPPVAAPAKPKAKRQRRSRTDKLMAKLAPNLVAELTQEAPLSVNALRTAADDEHLRALERVAHCQELADRLAKACKRAKVASRAADDLVRQRKQHCECAHAQVQAASDKLCQTVLQALTALRDSNERGSVAIEKLRLQVERSMKAGAGAAGAAASPTANGGPLCVLGSGRGGPGTPVEEGPTFSVFMKLKAPVRIGPTESLLMHSPVWQAMHPRDSAERSAYRGLARRRPLNAKRKE